MTTHFSYLVSSIIGANHLAPNLLWLLLGLGSSEA